MRYQPGSKETYPAIVVTADDAPEGLDTIDDAGQSKLVSAVAASGERFTKRPSAIRLGPHLGVTWAAPAMAKVDGLSEPIDRESFALVIGGRLYTVEARAPKGKLDDQGRAAAMAVASALSPPVTVASQEASAGEGTASEPPPAEGDAQQPQAQAQKPQTDTSQPADAPSKPD